MKKKILIIVTAIFLITAVSVKLAEKFIINKVASSTKNIITIGSVSFRPPFSFKLGNVKIANAFFPISLKQIIVRPAFAMDSVAFSGPGGISIMNKQREVTIRGSASGNFKEGSVNIKKTFVNINQLGNFEVTGLLDKWGKEEVSLDINLKGTEIKDINELLDLKIPFDGKATGTVLLDIVQNQPAKKTITFDVVINNLSMETGSEFTAFVKGIYKIAEGRTDISEGKLLNSAGGQILFRGFVDRENFNLDFEAENMALEEFLKLIPLETRKKYNISMNGVTATMKDFNVTRIKKKSC